MRRRTGLRPVGGRGAARRERLDAVRAKLLDIAGHRCERCGERETKTNPLGLHHIRPRSRGGSDDETNLAVLCHGVGGCHGLVHDHLVDDWMDWVE